VTQDEIIAKIETDKTAIEIAAPKSGVIEALLFEDGATIGANVPILKLKAGAAGGAAPAAQAPTVPASKPAAQPVQPKAEPAAQVPTSQPAVPPVPQAPKSRTPIAQIPVTPLQTEASGPVDISKIGGSRAETRVKMSKMRQTVASRLKTAQNTCAMLTTFNEINMGFDILILIRALFSNAIFLMKFYFIIHRNLVELRKAFGEQFSKKHNLKLGFMSAFVKASAYALQDQPIVNAVIENNQIVYRDYVDISVAVATPKVLIFFFYLIFYYITLTLFSYQITFNSIEIKIIIQRVWLCLCFVMSNV